MKRFALGFLILLMVLFFNSLTFSEEVSFTKEDRDRLIRLEVKLEKSYKFLQKQIDEVSKSLQKQIDDLRTFMLWGFGILFGGMGLLIGFVIWDRRTAVAPVARGQRELEERSEKIEKAFKELAKHDSRVAEILRNVGLL